MTVIKSDSVPVIIRTPVEKDIEIAAANTATIAVRFNTNFDNNRSPSWINLNKRANLLINPADSFTDMVFRNTYIRTTHDYNPQLNNYAVDNITTLLELRIATYDPL